MFNKFMIIFQIIQKKLNNFLYFFGFILETIINLLLFFKQKQGLKGADSNLKCNGGKFS